MMDGCDSGILSCSSSVTRQKSCFSKEDEIISKKMQKDPVFTPTISPNLSLILDYEERRETISRFSPLTSPVLEPIDFNTSITVSSSTSSSTKASTHQIQSSSTSIFHPINYSQNVSSIKSLSLNSPCLEPTSLKPATFMSLFTSKNSCIEQKILDPTSSNNTHANYDNEIEINQDQYFTDEEEDEAEEEEDCDQDYFNQDEDIDDSINIPENAPEENNNQTPGTRKRSSSRKKQNQQQPTGFVNNRERRQHHKAAEQKRRDCLKQGFNDLRSVLPLDKNKSHSRMAVLKFTRNYIQSLLRENASLQQKLSHCINK